MTTLGQAAKYVRSKNAGPFALTVDIFFGDQASYEKVRDSGVISREEIARRYAVKAEDVRIFPVDSLRTLKISIPRPRVQGDRYERDMHAGQQYVRLLDLPIPSPA